MIYIDNIQTSQTVYVPRNGSKMTGVLTLVAKHTIENKTIRMSSSDSGNSDLYHIINVTLPANAPIGEYEYALMKGTLTLSSGLLLIKGETSVNEYNNTIEYDEYINE